MQLQTASTPDHQQTALGIGAVVCHRPFQVQKSRMPASGKLPSKQWIARRTITPPRPVHAPAPCPELGTLTEPGRIQPVVLTAGTTAMIHMYSVTNPRPFPWCRPTASPCRHRYTAPIPAATPSR
jgi:hypothetical protein